MNALNNINFYGVANPSANQTRSQVTTAYTDPNPQFDPGGRLIQIVLRFNFQSIRPTSEGGMRCKGIPPRSISV